MRFLPRRRLAVALLFACVAAALLAFPAGATFPGANGQIAFDRTSDSDNGIYTANPDGHGESLLVANACCGGWSPSGNQLATGYGTTDGRIGTAEINADGTGYTTFPINDPTLNLACGRWSPDATQLACEAWDDSTTGRTGIWTVSATTGGDAHQWTANPMGGHDIPGSYSPDGKQLVFYRSDADDSPSSRSLNVLNLSDGSVRQLTPNGMILNIGADWSPDGTQIIFSRHVTRNVHGSIWVINSDGSGLRQIHIPGLPCGGANASPVSYGCHAPGWSPDGTKIVFAAGSGKTGTNIYTANANGLGLQQVTHDGDNDNPTWGSHALAP
jgi:Tol biopolymer transport system component